MTERTERDRPTITDTALDTMFEAGRAQAPEPSAALLARVMEDAMAEAEARRARASAPVSRRRRSGRLGMLGGLVAALGGWPSMAGLATAGVVGIWLGYAAPAGLDAVTTAMLGGGYEPADLMTSLDTFLQEG